MCRWIESHFHDWTYNGVVFLEKHIFQDLRVRKVWSVSIQNKQDSRLKTCYRFTKSGQNWLYNWPKNRLQWGRDSVRVAAHTR